MASISVRQVKTSIIAMANGIKREKLRCRSGSKRRRNNVERSYTACFKKNTASKKIKVYDTSSVIY